MKKAIIATLAVLSCIGVLAVGGLLVMKYDWLHQEAKGLLLYGTADQLDADEKIAAGEDASYTYRTTVKIADEQLLIIRYQDIQELCRQELVNKVIAVGEKDKSLPVTSVQEPADLPVLYTKDAKDTVTIAGMEQKATPGEDLVLGKSREFKNGYLVVSDKQYDAIALPETGLLALGFPDAADKKITSYQYDTVQLTDIREAQ